MKTSGIIRIWAIVILSALAILLTRPASAQLYFASDRSFSFKNIDKLFASNKNPRSSDATVIDKADSLTPTTIFSFGNTSGDRHFYLQSDNDSFATGENITDPAGNIAIQFRNTSFAYPENCRTDIGVGEYSSELLILYAKSLKAYARKNGFDTSYAFLSNMGMLCNRKRFFVVNLETMEIEQAGLVAHGRGQGPTIYVKQYSDEAGSRCTSLGRYKILGRYRGNYGEAYRVVGLDSTNQNAYKRNIVLHSMDCIPDVEGRIPACVSDGCPAVSPKFLSYLRKIIDSRKRPMLLWIFDSNLSEPVTWPGRARPVSLMLTASAKNCFEMSRIPEDQQLHGILHPPTHQSRIFKWVSDAKKKLFHG